MQVLSMLTSPFLPHTQTREFDSSYSKLVYAAPPADTETAEVTSAQMFLATQLQDLCKRRPGIYLPEVMQLKEAAQQGLQQICQTAQVSLQ